MQLRLIIMSQIINWNWNSHAEGKKLSCHLDGKLLLLRIYSFIFFSPDFLNRWGHRFQCAFFDRLGFFDLFCCCFSPLCFRLTHCKWGGKTGGEFKCPMHQKSKLWFKETFWWVVFKQWSESPGALVGHLLATGDWEGAVRSSRILDARACFTLPILFDIPDSHKEICCRENK